MDGHCEKHVFEATEGLCRSCGGEFCGDCLVYAYGAKKPPFCVSCALSAAGVRSSAARPQVRSKRDVRREMKELRRREKVAAKAKGSRGSAEDLFAATTIPATRPVVEFEFTISDDGTVERPEVVDDEPAAPVEPRVMSLFDQVEERVG